MYICTAFRRPHLFSALLIFLDFGSTTILPARAVRLQFWFLLCRPPTPQAYCIDKWDVLALRCRSFAEQVLVLLTGIARLLGSRRGLAETTGQLRRRGSTSQGQVPSNLYVNQRGYLPFSLGMDVHVQIGYR